MKSGFVGRALLAATFFSAWGVANGASAGIFRAYLSSTGNDANPCTLVAPCRLLPAGLAAVVDGGRITLMDSANYNTAQVDITKSVTIDANPGGSASVVGIINSSAIKVNGAGIVVTLRNLAMISLDGIGFYGVNFAQGAQLTVENCEISNMVNGGILVTAPGSSVTVTNTELRNDNVGFWATGTTVATLDGVNSHDNFAGIILEDGARVTVTGSTLANNTLYGALVESSSVTGTVLVLARSTISGSAGTLGVTVTASSGLSAAAYVETSVLHIGFGFRWLNSGGTEIISSSGDNRLVYYNAPTFGGSLLNLPGI